MHSSPLVSVVIPTCNRPVLLERAIESARDQSFRDIEVIVVDDGSEGDTAQVIACSMEKDARIKCIRNKKRIGGAAARNRGIDIAKGKYIAFLDDDDVWRRRKLESQLALMERSKIDVACTCAFFKRYLHFFSKTYYPPPDVTLQQILKANILGGASVCFCRTSMLRRIGGFNPCLKSCQDWDLWIRLRQLGRISTCREPLVDYFVHYGRRISRDMEAKYEGTRKVYHLYRALMDEDTAKGNVAYLLYLRSRQPQRPLRSRVKNLCLCVSIGGVASSWHYALSSFPRVFIDACKPVRMYETSSKITSQTE